MTIFHRFLLSFAGIILVPGLVMSQWTSIGTFNGHVNDMIVYDTTLFIGGDFTTLDGNSSQWSAIWDGTSMTRNLSGLDGTGINQFGIYDFDLYAVGFVDDDGLADWDGTEWRSFGNFTDDHLSILGDGQDLFVCSDVGLTSQSVSGAAFTTLPILGQPVYALDSFAGSLYAGGEFTSSPTGVVNRIAEWDGLEWQPLGTGVAGGLGAGSVLCMQSYKGELYVGGIFTVAGGVQANNLAKWNGSSWSDVGGSLPNGIGNGILDMVVFNDEL